MYAENDLVRIAKRENNTKRNYLVVNALQGKHIPVSPSKALNLFKDLAKIVKNEYKNEKLLVIGFAETATAIGTQVAIELEALYMQTTREIIDDVDYLFFSEEHSHATEQKLVKNDFDLAIEKIDRVLFVEDEVTTGKTILNIISLIRKKYLKKLKFSVLSILNGMSPEHLGLYADEEIDLHYLVKTDHSKYSDIADSYNCDGTYIESNCTSVDFRELFVGNYLNSRRLVEANKYYDSCDSLWKYVETIIKDYTGNNILVVGTEEMMYPAMYVAEHIEEQGKLVKCHSTTRSPIAVSNESNYPLHTRYELKSLYDSDRRTFIYDIQSYDYVLVITDANNTERMGVDSLINAISTQNDKITLFRWC